MWSTFRVVELLVVKKLWPNYLWSNYLWSTYMDGPTSFPTFDKSQWYKRNSSSTNWLSVYVEKKPVTLKECCVEYWYKQARKYISRWTGHRDRKLLNNALKPNQSINVYVCIQRTCNTARFTGLLIYLYSYFFSGSLEPIAIVANFRNDASFWDWNLDRRFTISALNY